MELKRVQDREQLAARTQEEFLGQLGKKALT